jgi:hypothetical protein
MHFRRLMLPVAEQRLVCFRSSVLQSNHSQGEPIEGLLPLAQLAPQRRDPRCRAAAGIYCRLHDLKCASIRRRGLTQPDL